MGRPKKKVPATKKIKLSETQKRYAKMVTSIEADLGKKKIALESLDKQIAKLQEQRRIADAERQNLEGAKKNLENILSQIPPPPEWEKFQKYVYEYHHHYHYHNHGQAPIFVYPWWHYYYGGNYIYYPTISQLQVTSVTTSEALPNQTDITTLFNVPNSGYNFSSGSLPNGSVLFSDTVQSGFAAGPGVNTVCFTSSANAGGFTMTNSLGDAPPMVTSYVTGDFNTQSSVTALAELGFFDSGIPPVDGADLSIGDLAKAAK